MDEALITIQAGAVRDADQVRARPGAVAVRGGRIVAAGEPGEVRRIAGQPDRVIHRPEHLILPGMVNAHAHLDLSAIGPMPYDPASGFTGWVRAVMARRPVGAEAVTAAVRQGLRQSCDAGVALIGDIAGSPDAVAARQQADAKDAGRPGVSYLECFGLGARQAKAADDALAARDKLRQAVAPAGARADDSPPSATVELQPHAPYSAGLELYLAATRHAIAAPCTHLAETRDELTFVRDAAGAFADLLREFGKWDESLKPTGLTPVQYLQKPLSITPWLVVHGNYLTDVDITLLAKAGASLAYCPIASDYFGHTSHRYRDLLAAGVNVCLGTDSILCQPAGEAQPLGLLPQLRRLYQRDRTDPVTLLAMATTHGAQALFPDHPQAKAAPTLSAGQQAQLTAVRFDPQDQTDPLLQVLLRKEPAEPLMM